MLLLLLLLLLRHQKLKTQEDDLITDYTNALSLS